MAYVLRWRGIVLGPDYLATADGGTTMKQSEALRFETRQEAKKSQPAATYAYAGGIDDVFGWRVVKLVRKGSRR